MKQPILIYFLLGVSILSYAQKKPIARIEPHTDTLFSICIDDPYHWMENIGSRKVKKYIKTENAYTKTIKRKVSKLQKEYRNELSSHFTLSQPSIEILTKPDGEYIYYPKISGFSMLLCRKSRYHTGKETLLINTKKATRGLRNYELMAYAISPDQKKIGYIIGNESDLSKDAILKIEAIDENGLKLDELFNVVNFIWLDNQTILYTPYNKEFDNTDRVYKHQIGTSQNMDSVVYQEYEAGCMIDLKISSSRKYAFIEISNNVFSEYYHLNTDNEEPLIIFPREVGVKYQIDHYGNDTVFHMLTNRNAPNYCYGKTKINRISESLHFEELIHESDARIEYVHHMGNYYIVGQYKDWSTDIVIIEKESGYKMPITFDEVAHRSQYMFLDTIDQKIRFKYCSVLTPDIYYDYDLKTHKLNKLFETQVKNYKKEQYTTDVKYVLSHDSLLIPILIIYKKSTLRNGSAPTQMSVYGSYGYQYAPRFDHTLPAMLDRGFYYVHCDVRGGGGEGSTWHLLGSSTYKKNTAYDIVSVANYLVKESYSSFQNLYATGSSAGGIALGMVINMFPEIFKEVTFISPKLDVLFIDYEYDKSEYGDPQKKDDFLNMLDYSPYQNIKSQAYPAMHFIVGYRDRNIQCSETLKMIAKLRANNTTNNPIILDMDMSGDHYRINYKKRLSPITFKLSLYYKIL